MTLDEMAEALRAAGYTVGPPRDALVALPWEAAPGGDRLRRREGTQSIAAYVSCETARCTCCCGMPHMTYRWRVRLHGDRKPSVDTGYETTMALAQGTADAQLLHWLKQERALRTAEAPTPVQGRLSLAPEQ
jgi:hypothetical protein